MDSNVFISPLVGSAMNHQLEITKSKMCCGPHAVSDASGFCRTSPVFLTFSFLRDVDTGDSCRPTTPGKSCFFQLRNVAVAHTPLKVLTKCCCGPKETPCFVFSIFANFTKCACSPRGVKNSLFTKKHRNR